MYIHNILRYPHNLICCVFSLLFTWSTHCLSIIRYRIVVVFLFATTLNSCYPTFILLEFYQTYLSSLQLQTFLHHTFIKNTPHLTTLYISYFPLSYNDLLLILISSVFNTPYLIPFLWPLFLAYLPIFTRYIHFLPMRCNVSFLVFQYPLSTHSLYCLFTFFGLPFFYGGVMFVTSSYLPSCNLFYIFFLTHLSSLQLQTTPTLLVEDPSPFFENPEYLTVLLFLHAMIFILLRTPEPFLYCSL